MVPNLSVAMATCGGSPRKTREGTEIKPPAPITESKKPVARPMREINNGVDVSGILKIC